MHFLNRLRALGKRGKLESDLDEELQFHVEMKTRENVEAGMPPGEARKAALRQFGNLARTKEIAREAWTFPRLESVLQDIRYGLRQLRRNPGFTAVVVITLALGIGATTAIYSVVHTVWLQPLPYRAPDRVVRVWETNSRLNIGKFSASVPNFVSWRERSRSFESLTAIMGTNANLTGHGEPERVLGAAVTVGFFGTLGIRPLLGRSFAAGEDAPGGARVAAGRGSLTESPPHVTYLSG